MSKEHFGIGSGEGKGTSATSGNVGTGVTIEGKELSHDDLAALKVSNPDLHSKIEKMRQEGRSQQLAEAGKSRQAAIMSPQGERRSGRPRREKRISTIPTGARGASEGPRPGAKDVAQKLEGHAKTYQTLLNTAASIKTLSPEHRAAIDTARGHLNASLTSHQNAIKAAKVGREGEADPYKWSKDLNTESVHNHLQDSALHFARAHETIIGAKLHKALTEHNLNSEIPSDDTVRGVSASAYQLSRVGVGGKAGATKSFGKVGMGRATIPGAAIDDEALRKARAVGGTESVAVQKLEAGAKGTSRDPQRAEKKKQALSAINKKRVESGISPVSKLPREIGGQISGIAKESPINPKRRGRGVRVETRFSSDANKLGRTPKFKG
jgi:hypothetical protein